MTQISVRTFGRYLLLSMTLCGAAHGSTWLVGKSQTSCGGAKFSTIAAALSAAAPGDQIDICPALYPEQLILTKPVTLRGISVNGNDRVLIQPAPLAALAGLPFEAVITVMNTGGVVLENLAIDAGNNNVSGCATVSNGAITGSLAAVHFFNSSGSVQNSALFGARLNQPSCSTPAGDVPVLFPGNGYGVQVDTDGKATGPFHVSIEHNSIHDFSRNGVLAAGSGVNVEVEGNAITGAGPSSGSNQFGVFIALGAVARVNRNVISEGNCGTLGIMDCINLRSEGVVLRSAGDGTVIDFNVITNAQSGIFLNGANAARVTFNVIKNIDALSGMDIPALTNSLIEGNQISQVGPISQDASNDEEGCGINEFGGAPISGNRLRNNTVNDAFCGVAHVTADSVESGTYFNTLYTVLNSDQYPMAYPPATEPQ